MYKTFFAFALAAGALALPAYGGTIVSLTPNNGSQIAGSFFDVFVNISGSLDAPHDSAGNTFSGFGFDVNVSDQSVLQFDGYTLGNLFDLNDFSGFFGADVSAGSNDPGGISESDFNLAVLHFTALGAGSSSLQVLAGYDPTEDLGLVYTNLTDPGGGINTSIDIAVTTPEPATWMLTAFSLAGAVGLRKRVIAQRA